MGIDDAREVGRGSRYRWLRLKSGDKVAMWCLTVGKRGDDNFVAAEFHQFEEGKRFRQIPCMRSLAKDHCYLCDRDEGDLKRLFALWVWVDGFFHPYPNPDPEGEEWQQGRVDGRVMHRELVSGPMILRMSFGMDEDRINLFETAFGRGEHESLMEHKYKLHRIGGDINTRYEMTVLRPAKPPEEALEALKSLPTIREVFQETVDAFLPKQTAAEDLTEEYQEMEGDSSPSDGDGRSAAKEPDEVVQPPKKRGPGRPAKVAQAVTEEAEFEPLDEEQEVGDALM